MSNPAARPLLGIALAPWASILVFLAVFLGHGLPGANSAGVAVAQGWGLGITSAYWSLAVTAAAHVAVRRWRANISRVVVEASSVSLLLAVAYKVQHQLDPWSFDVTDWAVIASSGFSGLIFWELSKAFWRQRSGGVAVQETTLPQKTLVTLELALACGFMIYGANVFRLDQLGFGIIIGVLFVHLGGMMFFAAAGVLLGRLAIGLALHLPMIVYILAIVYMAVYPFQSSLIR